MDYIQKLPFILGSLTAIIAGLISYGTGTKQQEIYIRMAIFLTLFFALGLFVRHSILKIQNEIEEKKIELIKAEELKKKKESEANDSSAPSIIDYKVDDDTDEFSPLTVSEIIKSQMNK